MSHVFGLSRAFQREVGELVGVEVQSFKHDEATCLISYTKRFTPVSPQSSNFGREHGGAGEKSSSIGSCQEDFTFMPESCP